VLVFHRQLRVQQYQEVAVVAVALTHPVTQEVLQPLAVQQETLMTTT
jgi:hypothetical protein